MNRRKFSAAALRLALASACASALMLCLSPSAFAQEAKPAPTPDPAKVFRAAGEVTARGSSVVEAFEFEMNGFAYHIKINGNGRRTKGDRTRRFNLRVDGLIERVYYSEYRGDLLLVCELDYAETGEGVVTLLGQPSMRARWSQRFGTFNVGEPLRDGRHLYVTTIGFVARLDLSTGEVVWQQDDLYGRAGEGSFNAFTVPEVGGDAVTFRERNFDSTAHRVVVNKKTGKIVRVE